jgi:hypothetical protein
MGLTSKTLLNCQCHRYESIGSAYSPIFRVQFKLAKMVLMKRLDTFYRWLLLVILAPWLVSCGGGGDPGVQHDAAFTQTGVAVPNVQAQFEGLKHHPEVLAWRWPGAGRM